MGKLLAFILGISALVCAAHYGMHGTWPTRASLSNDTRKALDNVRQAARRIRGGSDQRLDKVYQAGSSD